MKKNLLFSLLLLLSIINVFSQPKECQPKNFKRATVPQKYKNLGSEIYLHPLKDAVISTAQTVGTYSINKKANSHANSNFTDDVVGFTFYDLQTNNSIRNCISNNDDGTISIVYNFSPNAIQTSSPPFPDRNAHYDYFDGTSWLYFPSSSQDTLQILFSNIVVTPSGKEMSIGHIIILNSLGQSTDSTDIVVEWKANKGGPVWDTIMYPWGNHQSYSLPKACGGLTNENVYVIFQGDRNPTIPMSPPSTVEGKNGPLYFAKSVDGGLTWSSCTVLSDIDSTHYRGFSGDSYSIDAKGDTIAITFGDAFTDVGLLKSTDAGQTWTKSIIQLHPQPFYDPVVDSLSDYNHDGIADTISSNGGDSKVLIDNNGMCHVWFSALRYLNDVAGNGSYTAFYGTDNLFYWNETMNPNNGYVAIASAQDYNGNGILDAPQDTFSNCQNDVPWGQFGGGITQMPSAGIDAQGNIYLTYQTINESADTTFYHACHRHVYVMSLAPPYNPATWTYPYDIVPSIADGGDGENQEAVFGSTARRVSGNSVTILYQRDNAPGHALSPLNSCDRMKNLGNASDIIVCHQNLIPLNAPQVVEQNISVSQNYPNPASSSTEINFRINKSTDVRLEIFDVVGKIIYRENKTGLAIGTHSFQLNTSEFGSGIYNYSVIAGGVKITKQMMIY